jgi:hypothetical protein
MIGWITAVLASGPARKALGLFLAAATLALFLLNLRRAGERTGRLAERLASIRPVDARSQAFSGGQFHGMSSSMRLIL